MLFSDLFKRLKNNLIILFQSIFITLIVIGIVILFGYIGKFIMNLFTKNVDWFDGISFILLLIVIVLLVCWIIYKIKELIYYIKDMWNKSNIN